VMLTRTLLWAGEGQSGAPVFRAYDKATGEVLAELELPNRQTGVPMTYMHDGRQFVVLSVGGRGAPAELVAFALPVDQ
jgi:glucose dehydrogenase